MVKPQDLIIHHVDLLFGISCAASLSNIYCTYSRRTGKVRSFGSKRTLFGTFRSDGGIALSVSGAAVLLPIRNFYRNCVIPKSEAIPFITKSRSLFCKHVLWMGSNISVGSEAVIVSEINQVLAVGKSLTNIIYLNSNPDRGVAVKIREGLKGRTTEELI
ncbi:MAG TPA: PUA domain-containing protein [Nitrososphaeraceae archaeon]